MANGGEHGLELLVAKLAMLGTLTVEDRQAIGSLPTRIKEQSGGAVLMRDGDVVTECAVLLSGYAFRSKQTREGQRQIVAFQIPGDILDLQHLLLDRADHSIELITDATVAWITADALRELARERPEIGLAMWRDTMIDASIYREWVLNVGQRDGRARVAHMLCEFAFRRQQAGLGDTERFDLPMTQEHIADATGMTPVHVNRMLAALTAEGVIARQRRQIEIGDWDKIRQVGGFDPAYLHPANRSGAAVGVAAGAGA